MPTRTPEEIRASIEQHRAELGASLETLRGEVEQLTDWRAQLRAHQQQLMIAAGVGGFLLGGGIAGIAALLAGRSDRAPDKGGSKRSKKNKKKK
jgi:C4-dicarboxylate-specific signal transduction histidine kinase